MSEISLSHLRQLRTRATVLLDKLQVDLQPFVKDDGTFRRKPDSSSAKGDINVTTTCSCLMSLALTNKFEAFYKFIFKDKYSDIFPDGADALFTTLAKAPWMSSGLTANNAFTTTLVIRTLGFLEEEKLFGLKTLEEQSVQKIPIKTWELDLGIANVLALVTSLTKTDSASNFLWLSLSDKTRDLLNLYKGATDLDPEAQKKLKKALTVDLRNIIQSGWIYEESRFDKASAETKTQLEKKPTGYPLAEVNHWLLVNQYPDAFVKPKARSMTDIAKLMASDADNFSINEYPPSAAVIYWFADGIARARIRLDPPQWNMLCTWAAKEFNHQRSLLVAEHDAMMDPVSMGMAACLCARLRSTANKEHLATLPSRVELEQSIRELFKQQTKSGIWHKYFPLFHYQDAGSNFCFTFELLEAVLHEFGSTDNLLVDPLFFNGLQKAVAWCEKNRQDASEEYSGWNSGGYIDTLQKGQPESWATAVVHMFLSELTTALSHCIQKEVLGKYQVKLPKSKAVAPQNKEKAAISKLLDIEIFLPGRRVLLSDLLWTDIIGHYKNQDELSLRRNPVKNQPVSVLLFGPPGTSKTEVTNAIASDLNWPLVELTPSNFVRDSLANVYVQAEEIFKDLMDLAGVVIFFDEMDALVQTREGEARLDVVSQFLTTTMLPQLTRLHNGGQAVFFMATNFQDQFDAAIKRAGRFDLLLCMGPPILDEKLNRLHIAFAGEKLDDESKIKKAEEQGIAAGKTIREYLKDKPELQTQLGLYTYGEFKAFLKKFGTSQDIADKVAALGKDKFITELTEYTNSVTLRLVDVEDLLKHFHRKRFEELIADKFSLQELKQANIRITPVVRYLCDQKESKEQY